MTISNSTKEVWVLVQCQNQRNNWLEIPYEVFAEKEDCFSKYPVRWRSVEGDGYATNFTHKFKEHKQFTVLALRKVPFIEKSDVTN